jgi:subtilisin family serine protease
MVALAVYILGSFPSPAGAPVGEVRVIILFKDRPDASAVARAGGRVLSTYSIVPGLAAVLPADALEKLRSNPVVVHVEPDAVLRVLGEQVPWGITRIEAPSAWPTSTGEGVKVAILDTGIQHDHPDLAANVKGGVSLLGSENSTDPSSWNDGNGHGTHVAGIVAAASNGFGVIGAAPSAWLYAVKVFADNGEGYLSDVIEGIDWCVGNGIKIINMSFGAEDDYLPLRLACDRAYRQGLLLVAAAGNEGDNGVLYPAKYDSVMAVAATDVNDVVAQWSSRGPEVELSAPGVGIYSTYINSGYASLSGTSMAAPHVAGAAALLWARCPSLANENVRSILRQLAVDLGSPGWDNAYGFGLVRTPRYEVAVTISPSERSAPPGTALEFEVRVTNGGNAADNYSLFASDELGWELSLSPASLSLGPGENGVAALTVTTPENAPLGSVDNIWVRATSRTDEAVSASASCAASVGRISLRLATLFQVCVDLDVFIEQNSKLVLKFYTYGGTYQGENVLWSGETTIRLVLRENMPHPENKPVEQIVLELVTDNSSQTISRFVVTRGNLMGRITEIKAGGPTPLPRRGVRSCRRSCHKKQVALRAKLGVPDEVPK